MKTLPAIGFIFLIVAPLIAQTAPATSAGTSPAGIPKDWVSYAAKKAFFFYGAPDLKELEVANLQGVLSHVGAWKNPAMSISFDYGRYPGKVEGPDAKTENIKIDGRDVVLTTFKDGAGIVVEEVHPGTKDNIHLSFRITCAEADVPTAVTLIKTITFGNASASGD